MTPIRSARATQPWTAALRPERLVGRWQVDDRATVARVAERSETDPAVVRAELEAIGLLRATLTIKGSTFILKPDENDASLAASDTATYRPARGIPCGYNELWLQFTWDDMLAQPYQYLLVTLLEPDRVVVEWPNDSTIEYVRQP